MSRRRWRDEPGRGLAAFALMLLAACGEPTAPTAADGAFAQPGLLVVGGDYQSTVLSRVTIDTPRAVAPAFLHSGSVVGQSGAALSGDVVPGRVLDGSGDALVVDRGKATLTRLRGLDVAWQRNLGPGFAANPQDAVAIALPTGERRIVVARGQPDPAATSSDDPLAGGDDVLLLDADGNPLHRLPLAATATLAGAMAMAGSGAWDGEALWLPLASISPAFDEVGTARLLRVRVGATALLPTASLDLPPMQNCRVARRLATSGRVVVACSGSFAAQPAAQRAGSGVVLLQAAGDAMVRVASWSADALTEGKAPLGFALAIADAPERAWVVGLGDLEAGREDALIRLDLGTGAVNRVATGRGSFVLGGLWHDPARSVLWAADSGIPPAGAAVGDLRRFDTAKGVELEPLAATPNGLRALELAPW